MKSSWQSKTLGEVLQKTETINPLQSPNTEFEYIDVSSISNVTFRIKETQRLKGKDAPSRARRLVKANDVLFATVRPTLRRIAIVNKDLDSQICSTGYFVFRPTPEVDHRFIFYFLFSDEFMGQMEKLQKGASYPAVTDAEVRRQKILIPPFQEQQRIIRILDKAFEDIATAKANAEKNLQNARAIFESQMDSLFLKRCNGWTEKSVAKLVDDGILQKPFDGNHGEIHPHKSDYTASGVPFIMAADLLNGEVDTKDCKFIPRKLADTLRVGFAKDGDVLISHKGTIGRSAIVHTDSDYIMLTPQVTAYRINNPGSLSNKYLRRYFMSPIFQREMGSLAEGGATRAYIGITRQLSLTIRYPPLKEQNQIASKLDELELETQRLEIIYRQKSEALVELKHSMLNQAFSGNL